jgi:diguanylate cyclase (GGDEF)-like protein
MTQEREGAGTPWLLVLVGVASALGASWSLRYGSQHVMLALVAVATMSYAGLARWLWVSRAQIRSSLSRHLIPATMTVAITLAFLATEPGRNGVLLAYLWMVPFVFNSFPWRQVAFHAGAMLVAAWAVLVAHAREGGYGVTDNRVLAVGCFFTMTVLALGMIVRRGARSLLRSRHLAQRHAERSGALAELSAAALHDVHLSQLLDDLTRTCRSLIHGDVVVVLRAMDAGLGLAGQSGWPAPCPPRAAVVGDRLGDVADAAGATEVHSEPIAIGGQTWGWLAVLSNGPRRFDVDDRQTLRALAGLLTVVISRDQAKLELAHQSSHDPLTTLPNRFLFHELLSSALARVSRTETQVAVLLLDLDEFKIVNDSLGHSAGDELLHTGAHRLAAVLRSGDSLARLGGDEFAVLLQDLHGPEDALMAAAHLQEAISAPITVDTHSFVISASVGIALAARGSDKAPEQMLREADSAMYHAKKRRRGLIELFDEDLQVQVTRRLALEAELREAVRTRQIRVVYQPVVEPRTGRVTGAEALARWTSPTYGPVAPPEFIAIADETGLIDGLTEQVLTRALAAAAGWRARIPGFTIAVNVTPRQLQNPRLGLQIGSLLRGAELPPDALTLEITEVALGENVDEVLATLEVLSNMGVGFALDDFGTGYSSMARLRALPLSTLKVDRSFIDDEEILRTIAALSDNLRLQPLAEGVETEEQRDRIVALGYDRAQGFLWSRPLPEGEATERMLAATAGRR